MRIILRFGGFRQEIRVPDSKAFQPIVIPHPQGKGMITLTETGIAPDEPIIFRRMTFEYSRQFEHDLLEYEFVKEE